jgi:hypothetical protein
LRVEGMRIAAEAGNATTLKLRATSRTHATRT